VTDDPYERAVRLARESIAAALEQGRTLEELEGGLLERDVLRRDRRSPARRARARQRGDRAAYRSPPARWRPETTR
jgi:hypothetical protein